MPNRVIVAHNEHSKGAIMPLDPVMEVLRPQLVANWMLKQSMLQRQNALFLEGATCAVAQFIRNCRAPSTILTSFKRLPGKVRQSKWEDSTPLDGELITGHDPAYMIDPLSTNFSGSDNVPGLRYQLTGRAGEDSLVVIFSVCRELDELYYIVHFSRVDARTHKSTNQYFDSRTNACFEDWLTAQL